MESIKKRSILQFALLNIVTLGIYGIVAGNSMGKDIDMLCQGDRETEVSYIKAWLLGIITGGIYLEYWWYKQANRMKYNAGRYNLVVRESGLSLVAFRSLKTIFGLLMSAYAIYKIVKSLTASLIMNSLGIFGSAYYSYAMGGTTDSLFEFNWIIKILIFIAIITPSWGLFGYVGLSFFIKNLNRYAVANDTYDALPFDPMGYEYYKAGCNYPDNAVISSDVTDTDTGTADRRVKQEESGRTELLLGHIEGIAGSNTGYRFELKDGEEIIIGKDPSLCSIIIDPSYKDVSRKHCGIIYMAVSNEYQIIDYSANGTYINGKRIPVRVKTKVSPGTEVTLAESDNKFRVG